MHWKHQTSLIVPMKARWELLETFGNNRFPENRSYFYNYPQKLLLSVILFLEWGGFLFMHVKRVSLFGKRRQNLLSKVGYCLSLPILDSRPLGTQRLFVSQWIRLVIFLVTLKIRAFVKHFVNFFHVLPLIEIEGTVYWKSILLINRGAFLLHACLHLDAIVLQIFSSYHK